MKSKADVSHEILGISSEKVREMNSILQLLTYQERVYSDVMDMSLKMDEVNYKIENADINVIPDLKENYGKLVYKKKLFNILLEQIKLRIKIVKASNLKDECQIFKDVAREFIAPNIFRKIMEESRKKFENQTL